MSVGLTVLQSMASSCSMAMILNSVLSVYRIHKTQDTGAVSLFPSLDSGSAVTSCSYFPLFALYLFGELTSTIYVSVFFRWTKARSHAVKTIAANVFAILLLTTYAVLGMTGVTGQTSGQVGDTVGCMMTVGCLLPYAAPLVTVKIVLKTRSGASIPLGMCLAGAISNALWMVAGYLDNDMFMGFFQVTLYVIYRPGRYPSPTETPFENLNCVLPLTSSLTVTSDTTVESLPSPTFISVCSP